MGRLVDTPELVQVPAAHEPDAHLKEQFLPCIEPRPGAR